MEELPSFKPTPPFQVGESILRVSPTSLPDGITYGKIYPVTKTHLKFSTIIDNDDMKFNISERYAHLWEVVDIYTNEGALRFLTSEEE